jgi:DNA-binding transcriptional LysR family regulator
MREPSWDAIRCFVAVSQCQSLSGAALELDMSVATLGRRIDSLEADLGLKLLRRGPTGVQLTEQGSAILKLADPGARQLAQVVRAARSLQLGPELPPIRISATEPLIADVLAPRLAALLAQAPEARIELEVSNALADLNSGASDLAIRMSNPADETLVARRLPTIRLGLFCSKSYLAGRNPEQLRLQDERLLWLDSQYGDIPENVWLKASGLESAVLMRSSSIRSLHNAAVSGSGIAPLPVYSAVAANLVGIPGPALPARQPWLVFHRDTRSIKRLQVVRDWVFDCCVSTFA